VYDLLPIHTRHFYPSSLALHVGEPIETKGLTPRQTEELNGRLRNAIDQLLHPDRAFAGAQVEEDALSAGD
jgi:1-acyl-sn-glycerol-3-phosphate acyltransferase